MKNILLLLLTTFTLTCCEKDDNNKPKTELEKLPPATQIGANTAGCLVDGKAFISKGYFPGGTGLTCNYIDGEDFTLSIAENINGKIRSVFIASYNQNLHDNIGTSFQLNENSANSKFGEYIIYNTDSTQDSYSTTSTVIGELKITNHNFNQAILSGTFWFNAVNSNGEKVEVREGRFDMQY